MKGANRKRMEQSLPSTTYLVRSQSNALNVRQLPATQGCCWAQEGTVSGNQDLWGRLGRTHLGSDDPKQDEPTHAFGPRLLMWGDQGWLT